MYIYILYYIIHLHWHHNGLVKLWASDETEARLGGKRPEHWATGLRLWNHDQHPPGGGRTNSCYKLWQAVRSCDKLLIDGFTVSPKLWSGDSKKHTSVGIMFSFWFFLQITFKTKQVSTCHSHFCFVRYSSRETQHDATTQWISCLSCPEISVPGLGSPASVYPWLASPWDKDLPVRCPKHWNGSTKDSNKLCVYIYTHYLLILIFIFIFTFIFTCRSIALDSSLHDWVVDSLTLHLGQRGCTWAPAVIPRAGA